MNLRYLSLVVVAGVLLTGCGAGTGVPDREILIPTQSDMRGIARDVEPSSPYSRYIYRIMGTDRSRTNEGIISVPSSSGQDLVLMVEGSKLKILADKTFMNTHDIKLGDSELLPFAGGSLAGGRLEVVPWFSKPVEFQPEWLPEGLTVSVDGKCNFLIRSRDPHMSETRKLVAFIDAKTRLDRMRCELLGTFQNIPQLHRIIKNPQGNGKHIDGQRYVLRLNWSDTFALVRIVPEDER